VVFHAREQMATERKVGGLSFADIAK
jgi:hypothetical protein